jgi:hypothetical protein
MKRIMQEQPPFSNPWLDYLIISILLFMSGNPAIMGETRMEVCTVIVSGLFLIMLAARRKIFPTGRFTVVLFVWSGILVIQCITFGFWPFHTMLGFLLRLFIGYAAVRLVKEFSRKYVSVMFYTCLISLFFHSFAILHATTGIDLITYFAPLDKIANPYRGFHIFIHNFIYYARVPEQSESYRLAYLNPFRNSSYFWEPGVLAAYILLAITFLGLMKDKFDKRRYRNILAVLVFTLLTTMSTTGYILLPLCLLFHLRAVHLTARQVPKMLGIALLLALFCVAAYHLDFVGEKIKEHRDKVAYREPGWETTRFGSLAYDLEYIKHRPFFGWGPNHTTRYMLHGGVKMKAMGNGLSDFTAKLGLVGLVTALTCIFAGAYHLTKSNWRIAALFVFFVVMVLNGEHLLDYSLFLGLMFVEPITFTTYGSPRGQQLWDMNEIGVRRFNMGKCGVHFL